jgi:hypothetical protein
VPLVIAGAPWYWILMACSWVMAGTSALLSHRAGVREPSIWRRLDRRRGAADVRRR